jgi:hypothetical protein
MAFAAKRQGSDRSNGSQQPLTGVAVEDQRTQQEEGRGEVEQPWFGAAELQRAEGARQQPKGGEHRRLLPQRGTPHLIGTSTLAVY